ncbi:MAG: hypothetical protein AAFR00_12515 [Pseudomonadota bacterium]
MAEISNDVAAQDDAHMTPAALPTGEPLNVMHGHCDRPETEDCGSSDLRHPEMPYWHPLNGPFPTD